MRPVRWARRGGPGAGLRLTGEQALRMLRDFRLCPTRIAEVDAQLEAQSAKAEPGFGRRKREHGIHGSHPTGLHPA